MALSGAALLVAEWNFWIGAGVTVLTLAAGWRAFDTVAHDALAHEMMIRHRNLAVITAGWALVIAAWLLLRRRLGRNPHGPVLGVAASVLLATTTGWHGGELVYRHGLGVMSLPDTGGHGHGGNGPPHRGGDAAGGGHDHMH